MFRKQTTLAVIGMLKADYERFKVEHSDQPMLVLFGLLYSLRPYEPFKSMTNDELSEMALELSKLNDTEKAFKFLALLTNKVLNENVTDKGQVKEAITTYVKVTLDESHDTK